MALTNYYEEFGLGRADSSTVIRENYDIELRRQGKPAEEDEHQIALFKT